jgi:hypothetical protein
MSNQSDEPETGISDEELPEDLQPTDDNPLAQPLAEDDDETKSREDLDVLGGKLPEQDDDDSDAPDETDATDDSED